MNRATSSSGSEFEEDDSQDAANFAAGVPVVMPEMAPKLRHLDKNSLASFERKYNKYVRLLEEANKNCPLLFPILPSLKPLPSSMFFLTLSLAFTGTFLASVGLYIPHEVKKNRIHKYIRIIFIKYFDYCISLN